MQFLIETLGCKVNAYESVVIKEKLIQNGYQYNEQNPDFFILNTCSVTNTADSKSKKIFRRLKRLYPNAISIVCGCSVQNNKDNFDADILIGNKDKSKIDTLIKEYLNNKHQYDLVTKMDKTDFEDMTIEKFSNIRAYIKIQDGCNNYCSYCIIPYLRGNLRCKDFDKVIDEAKTLVENGHKEIVLTGIHTGSYSSNDKDLCDLINELSKIKGLEIIRLSSIEITEIDNDKFYDILKNNSKFSNHLHIPLQAGSDEVLKRMNRKYDLDYYSRVLNKIRSIRPDISIATDCIVGHPYETDELFDNTLKFCESIKFSKIHVFPYSMRVGTAAAKMPQVSDAKKHERTKKLLDLSTKLEQDYKNKFIGCTMPILVEKSIDGFCYGHTNNMLYLKVKSDVKVNGFIDVCIKEDNYE